MEAIEPGPEAYAVLHHPEPARSAGALRAKVFGSRLRNSDYLALMQDTVANRLSDIELAAFVTACAGERLDHAETTSLTRAMIAVGRTLDWGSGPTLDKHCVGGLPGNRTTPIIVAIVAALGQRTARVVSTDTIAQTSNAISVARSFAQASAELLGLPESASGRDPAMIEPSACVRA